MRVEIKSRVVYDAVTCEVLASSIINYISRKGEEPEFCLMHENTYNKFKDEVRKYTSFLTSADVKTFRGVRLVRSNDITEGEFHLCGE